MASSSIVSPTIKIVVPSSLDKSSKYRNGLPNRTLKVMRTNDSSKLDTKLDDLYSGDVMDSEIAELYEAVPEDEIIVKRELSDDESCSYSSIKLKDSNCLDQDCVVNGVLITEGDDDPLLEDVAITEVCSDGVVNDSDEVHVNMTVTHQWNSNSILNDEDVKKFLSQLGCENNFEEISGKRYDIYCKVCQLTFTSNNVKELLHHLSTTLHQKKIVELELGSEHNTWSMDAIISLVNVMKAQHHRFLNPKSNRQLIWADIIQQMMSIGCEVNKNQCRHKWLQLKSDYEECVSSPMQGGVTEWPEHIRLMHLFLSDTEGTTSVPNNLTNCVPSDDLEYRELTADGNLIWKSELVNKFINIISNHRDLISNTGSISDWDLIQSNLQDLGFSISKLQCQRKWDNLRSGHFYYSRLAKKRLATITWQFYQVIDTLLVHVDSEKQIETEEIKEKEEISANESPSRGGYSMRRGRRGRGRGRGKRGRPRIHPIPTSVEDNINSSYQKPVRSTAGKHYKYSEGVGDIDQEEEILDNDLLEKQTGLQKQTKIKRDTSIEQLVESRVAEEVERQVGPLLERIRRLEERLLGITMDEDATAQFTTIDDPLIIDPNYPNNTHNVTVSNVREIGHLPAHITTQTLAGHGVSHASLVQGSDSIVISAPQEALLAENNGRVQNILTAPSGTEGHTVIYANSSQLDAGGNLNYSPDGQHITLSIGSNFSTADGTTGGSRSIILAPSDGSNAITLTSQIDQHGNNMLQQNRKRQIVTMRQPVHIAKKIRKK